ncbi:hypothetical protein [Rhodoflexus caldus]|uniref:hypothetical protein n=1 Tax=Rhodoflexus caldus TaxID=2891236 RepID=UPI00202A8225|nr:hypothetical protein [Rhodoflexus caldus]
MKTTDLMNQTLFNDDFLHLEYLPTENVLIETWYGFVDYARFVTATPIVLQAIQQTGAHLLLSDLSKLKVLREDAYSYLVHEKTRQLARQGIQAYALSINPEKAGGTATANLINVHVSLGGNHLDLACFHNTREAGIWLKEKSLQPQLNM